MRAKRPERVPRDERGLQPDAQQRDARDPLVPASQTTALEPQRPTVLDDDAVAIRVELVRFVADCHEGHRLARRARRGTTEETGAGLEANALNQHRLTDAREYDADLAYSCRAADPLKSGLRLDRGGA